MEEQRASRLAQARKAVKNTSPAGITKMGTKAISLMKYADSLDFLFVGVALAVALLKDILDFVGIGSLPAIGTIITLIVSITIWAMMMIIGANKPNVRAKKELMNRYGRRYGALVLGTIIEIVFGINFLPIETLIVIYIYRQVLLERRSARLAAQQ